MSTAFALSLGVSAAAQVGTLDSIDRYVRGELARQRIPGMSVAVLNGDSLLLARGYGSANLEHHVPAADSTMYEVGSVSKQFTAAATVLLAERGRLGLDDPVIRYLPEGSGVWPNVTIRHLLNHTSGIPDDTMPDYRRDYAEEELVRSAAAQPLDFTPGDRESYSSTGYFLLGVIIHRVTGIFYGDFLRDQIFRPLGMRTARINSASDIVPNRAAGYHFVNDTLKNQDWVSPSIGATADLGISLTALDLARWAVALNHGRVLSRAGWEASWTPLRLNNGGSVPYGFGWNVTQQRGYRRIGHSGSWQGFRATIQRYPEFDTTVIVLANLGEGDPQAIAFGIAGMLHPQLQPPHLLTSPLGMRPPTPIPELLSSIVAHQDSALVTPELRAFTATRRREQIGRWVTAIHTWTSLGCERVRDRSIARLRSRIEQICYAKGAAREGSLLFTVLYGSDWRAAGVEVYGF